METQSDEIDNVVDISKLPIAKGIDTYYVYALTNDTIAISSRRRKELDRKSLLCKAVKAKGFITKIYYKNRPSEIKYALPKEIIDFYGLNQQNEYVAIYDHSPFTQLRVRNKHLSLALEYLLPNIYGLH